MKHRVFGKKLKRDTNERKALFRGLISSLILRGKIKTTEAKAKAVKGQIDKVVTLAKKATLGARRRLLAILDVNAVEKLMTEVAPKFGERPSGFTQIIKIEPRKGDDAPMVLLRWVGITEISNEIKPQEPKGLKEKQKPREKVGKAEVKVNKKRTSKK